MSDKLNIKDVLIDDAPSDFSQALELTDEEYEAYREKRRKEIALKAKQIN